MMAIKSLYIALLILLSGLSLNHIYSVYDGLVFSNATLGWLGLAGVLFSLIFVGRRYFKQGVLVFAAFFLIGALKGPFLEPPSDPLDHLANAHRFCQEPAKDQKRKLNRGLWHYSMVSRVICPDKPWATTTGQKLRNIFIMHGFFMAAGLTSVFLVSRCAGLPGFWAFFSALLCFLFMGTNRFSYFTYYTLGPSSSSMAILWLWSAAFFFQKKPPALLQGLLVAAICLPILAVNHLQEAVFLCVMVFWWLLANFIERVWNHRNGRVSVKLVLVTGLLSLFFVLPQLEWFQTVLEQAFIYRNWDKNQALVLSWQGVHIVGKVWSFRVNDTLGLMGFLPLALSVVYLWPNRFSRTVPVKLRITILGLLPLLVYGTPLLNFIWVSNCIHKTTHIRYYYRMCYVSMYWLFLAHFLYHQARWVAQAFHGNSAAVPVSGKNSLKRGFALACLLLFIGLGTVRSSPVYGKLDFILVDSLSWRKAWKPMLAALEKDPGKPVLTDPMTRKVIKGILGQPVLKATLKGGRERLDIYELEQRAPIINGRVRCLVNLHPIKPTWVPGETGHWPSRAANVIRFYRYQGEKGDRLVARLKETPPVHCNVFFEAALSTPQ
jgi:hypothetical protein